MTGRRAGSETATERWVRVAFGDSGWGHSMDADAAIATLKKYEGELTCILSRFEKTRDGIHIQSEDDARFREIVLELTDFFDDVFADGGRHSQPLIAYFDEGISNWLGSPSFNSVEGVKGVVVATLARVRRNPLSLKTAALEGKARGLKDPEGVVKLAERLHLVVCQLRQRRENRPTLDVADEYDVQDLFHSLLRIYFDDVREEEWAPSYAGGASRMDFLLPEIEAVVETKKTRPSLSTKQLGEELIVDIAKYRKHPSCRTLFCVVYDPDGRIKNPRGVENDLNTVDDKMATHVLIVP